MFRSFPLFMLVALGHMACAQTDSINVGGFWRSFTVRLPSVYDGTDALPLVLALHGGFGSGTQLETQSQLTAKAEQEGFIIVFPDGVASQLNIRTWNAGGCCGYAMNNDIDDVGFIQALLDTLLADYSIDPLRTYVTGMSNGGFMSYRLACELSERIAAIAPVSASMTIDACTPARSVPVIALHSYADASVPYLGGIGTGISGHYNSPLDSVQNAFAAHADCNVLNDTILDDAGMTVIRWHECDCGQEVLTYMTYDGGHSWPGGVQMPGGDPVSTVIDANDLMWDFFQQHTLDCINTGITRASTAPDPTVFPNPTSGIFTVTGAHGMRLVVMDISGREVLAMAMAPGGTVHMDASSLAEGTYAVRVTMRGGEVRTARFVRQ